MADLFLVLFFVSFIGLIVGLINPSIFNRVTKREITRKKIGLVFGVAMLAFIILTGVTATDEPKEKVVQPEPEKITETKEVTEKEVSITEIEKKESGLGITRQSIIDVLEKPAIGFSFSLGVPVDGKENYVANKGGNVIQLLGEADNISEASIIAFMDSDEEGNLLSLIRVVGFANVIDSDSVDWVTNEFQKVSVDMSKPYSNTKIFDKKLFEVLFEPSSVFNSFSLIITPSQ